MAVKYYVDASGNQLGAVIGGPAPVGASEVPPPPHGHARWVDGDWQMPGSHSDPDAAARALRERVAEAKRAVRRRIAEIEDFVTDEVTAGERASWMTQELAALDVKAGVDSRGVRLLESMITITGETLNEIADAILVRADRFRALAAQLIALRRVTDAAIDAATTPGEVDAAAAAGLAKLDAIAAAIIPEEVS